MRKNAFIIAITGPSACGKTYITDKIINLSEQLRNEGIDFKPERFFKYVTRPYRETEVIHKNRREKIDVESVRVLPDDCELAYRTYGYEYGLKIIDLKELLIKGISPIVVINDVRVVEELKREFVGSVLSLFIFREIIPDKETHENASKNRGGGKSITRFEKAVALYRVFIENIFIFDRVILNVKYDGKTYDGKDFENIAYIQTENIIRGVINEEILLNKQIKKGPKLFIVSGNAASGKDDIIKAANQMGRLQTDILKKYTTRWQEADDENEIICKYKPKNGLVKKFNKEYEFRKSQFQKEYTFNYYMKNMQQESLNKYNDKNEEFKSCYTYKEFCKARYELDKLEEEKDNKTGIERFWDKINVEQEARSIPTKRDSNKKELPKKEYLWMRNNFFEINPEYLDIEDIEHRNWKQIEQEVAKIVDETENRSYFVRDGMKEYILYQNNNLYGKPVNYGFEVGNIKNSWDDREKHLVLTASLPNIFRICKEYFGKENVVTAFTYSQISQEEHLRHSDKVMGQAKLKEYQDILRYANHIVDFDYALIYAETSLENKTGNQKTELVDQMFRLFRVYNR